MTVLSCLLISVLAKALLFRLRRRRRSGRSDRRSGRRRTVWRCASGWQNRRARSRNRWRIWTNRRYRRRRLGARLLFQQLAAQSGVAARLVCVQDGQGEGEREEDPSQPAGELDQNVGRLRAENIFGHATAKSRAQSFALWPLHQDDQQHQERNQDVNREQEINQDLHRGRGI